MKTHLISAVLALSLVLSFLFPAVRAEEVWYCGQEAHTHVESCYGEDDAVICGLVQSHTMAKHIRYCWHPV